ncbi:SPTB2 protein, partial [Chunga burmeisteri]|nr:SPTB2 protein [Chunga burmeisteri]
VQRSEPQLPTGTATSPPASPLSDAPSGAEQSCGEPSSLTPHSVGPSEEAVIWDPTETSTLLLPPRGPGGLGGTVNLILSIGKKGEKKKGQPMAGSEQPGEEAPQTPWGSPLSPSLCSQAKVEARKTSGAKRPPAITRCPPASSGGTPAASHTLPKAGAGSLFNSLQRREQARAEQARLLTLQGIMGASSLQPTPEERHGPSNTWPQKCGRRKGGPETAAAGPPLGQLLLYVRNPLVRDIDAECGAAPWDPCLLDPKPTCPHLSLGSVLSLELPRDAVVLGGHRRAAAQREEAEGQEQRQGGRVRARESTDTHGAGGQEEVDVDGQSPRGPSEGLETFSKSERGTWFEEVSFNPSYSRQRAHHAGEERWSPRCPGSAGEDLPDFRPRRPSHVGMLHAQAQEGDELAPRLGRDGSPGTTSTARHREASQLDLGPSPAGIPGRTGAIPGTACAQRPAGSGQPRGSSASPAAPTQLSVFEWALGSPQPPSPVSGTGEVCHPAHRQFEEEEEELQAIWDGAGDRRAPSPSAGSHAHRQLESGTGSPPSPDATASGPLILSSANNVLVAKFTLPTAARLLHSPSGEKSPGAGHGGGGSPSRHGVSPRAEELVAAVPLDGRGAWDRRRHGEEEREGSKVPPGKTEFQMMEGTLERKHVLQTGGRKANCRAWGFFHAVLMRQTLCFYQDRRDSLKSSVVALPLNLSGAVCTPDAEYTKKTNCFRLQLRDGSEYLLRAPSQPLMNEWVSKLQQNSGFPEVDYFQAAAQRVEGTSSAGGFSKVPSPGSSYLQGHHQVTTTKSQEIVVLPRSNARLQRPLGSQDGPAEGAVTAAEDAHGAGHREQQWSPRGSPGLWDNSCHDDDYGLVANKRRSYSFTSATYQKITPVAMPKEPVEAGGSYSVTLYIGEQAPAVPRARCHSFVARPGSPRDTLGEKIPGPPRAKNKSVFKKFFGKKE